MNTDARLTTTLKVLALVVLGAILLVGFVHLVERLRTVTTIVVGAIFLCYAIQPAVRRLSRRVPLWASILIVYAILIALIAASLGFIVPALSENVKEFIQDAPALAHNVQVALTDPQSAVGARLPLEVRNYIADLPSQLVTLVERYGAEVTRSFLSVVVSVVSILALFVAVPVVALYITLDTDAMYQEVISRIPVSARPIVLKILHEINTVLGGFIRGQLLVAVIVGVLIAVMLTIFHVRYAILIGLIAGLLEVIPYAGAVAGAVPAVLIALITNGPLNALFVTIGFVAINQVEGHFIAPFVVGQSVGLTPLAVILALFIGGELFGLPGLLIAVPVAGIIKVLFVNLVPRYAPPEQAPKPAPPPASDLKNG